MSNTTAEPAVSRKRYSSSDLRRGASRVASMLRPIWHAVTLGSSRLQPIAEDTGQIRQRNDSLNLVRYEGSEK